MADISVVHTFVTPAGTITFNDGADDEYYLGPIVGLDGTPARRVVDKTAYADGGLPFKPAFLDIRFFQPTGTMMIRSTKVGTAKQTIRNSMAADLEEAYESTLNADGTWAFTPLGGASKTLTVRRDAQAIAFDYVDNYLNYDFSFGLVAVNPVFA